MLDASPCIFVSLPLSDSILCMVGMELTRAAFLRAAFLRRSFAKGTREEYIDHAWLGIGHRGRLCSMSKNARGGEAETEAEVEVEAEAAGLGPKLVYARMSVPHLIDKERIVNGKKEEVT